jgi:hypothetical protein
VAAPTAFSDGVSLIIELVQNYQDGQHALGRFRLLATDERQPFRLHGIPADVAHGVGIPPQQRSDAQREVLASYLRQRDAKYQELAARVEQLASQPPPVDRQMQRLQAELATAQQPIELDPRLVQLRSEIKMSSEQLAQRRLTAAQDLAWALINSPAFLFNH